MRKKSQILVVALAGLFLTSCAGETKTDDKSAANEKDMEMEEVCMYSFDSDASTLAFTAYKFTEKAGVGGEFTDLQVEGNDQAESAKDLLESLSFQIPISGLSTKNKPRDKKIDSLFFGAINTEAITGEVISVDADAGMAIIAIMMNGVSNEVEGKCTMSGDKFTFDAEINVNNWNAQEGIKALNEGCKELHTKEDADGNMESKLWPDVSISFETTLKKECK